MVGQIMRAWCAVFACCVVLVSSPHAQDRRANGRVPDEAKRLVVQVIGYFAPGDAPEVGAGIIVGASSINVFIATARHVLYRQSVRVRDLRVVFPGHTKDTVPAIPMPATQTGLDLAVISVPIGSARGLHSSLPTFDRQGDAGSIKSGAPVNPVGCHDICWDAPSPPDQVLGKDLQGIIFQSTFIGPGSSGGALFNQWWEVVGMVIVDAPPRGEAIPIDRVLTQARYWGYPVDLKKTAVPRSGYRTSVGVSFLVPSPALGERPPGGRVTVSTRVIPHVTWHIGLLRLAPQNLAVTAGVVGMGLHLKTGRLALRPFVEVGFGHVEGQFDIGGYYVTTASDSRYVPVFSRVEADGLGVGGGAAIELTVLPRTILELLTGYWGFTTPENAPKLRNQFIGAGFRWGI
jgi:hypothetical protein